MPELPEVETIVSDLKKEAIVGEVISSVTNNWPRSIATHSFATFRKKIQGKTILNAHRRAKYLVFGLSGELFLIIHLRMSGRLSLCSSKEKRSTHEHVIFSFKSGRDLRFHDTRKFGRCYLTESLDAVLGHLGPEPLTPDFKFAEFYKGLQGTKRSVKTLLIDQSFVAGLGNIYVDESLWDAGIHPEKASSHLGFKDAKALYASIKKILKRGVKNLGTSLGKSDTNFYSVGKRRGRNQDKLNVFRRQGEPCPRCRMPIIRKVVGQRGTHLCPKCQKI